MKYLVVLAFAVFATAVDAFLIRSATRIATAPTSSAVPLQMTILTHKGQKKDFKAGSPLKNACAALGVKPKYSCKKGECASCTITVGGQRVKACVGKVPPEPKLKSLLEKGLEIK